VHVPVQCLEGNKLRKLFAPVFIAPTVFAALGRRHNHLALAPALVPAPAPAPAPMAGMARVHQPAAAAAPAGAAAASPSDEDYDEGGFEGDIGEGVLGR
jgi:hypothetical protein